MEDKLIEVWRAEFEKWYMPKFGFHDCFTLNKGEYFYTDIRARFECYVAAKRSQPVVELPIPQDIFDDYTMDNYLWYCKESVDSALTAAGIQYTVK